MRNPYQLSRSYSVRDITLVMTAGVDDRVLNPVSCPDQYRQTEERTPERAISDLYSRGIPCISLHHSSTRAQNKNLTTVVVLTDNHHSHYSTMPMGNNTGFDVIVRKMVEVHRLPKHHLGRGRLHDPIAEKNSFPRRPSQVKTLNIRFLVALDR
ncbi:hypothetical protein CPB85DRAFT_639039 [Mucidula mucida]|nr:hypothetical protein CPB85DRAFT_639039 [Mucidula mucida]